MQTLMVKLNSWSTFLLTCSCFHLLWRCTSVASSLEKGQRSVSSKGEREGESSLWPPRVRYSVFLSWSQLWISSFTMEKKKKERKPEFSKWRFRFQLDWHRRGGATLMALNCTVQLCRWQSHSAGQFMKEKLQRGVKGNSAFFLKNTLNIPWRVQSTSLTLTHSLMHAWTAKHHSYSQSIYSSFFNVNEPFRKHFSLTNPQRSMNLNIHKPQESRFLPVLANHHNVAHSIIINDD